jgi:uncharacterized Zn finger protein
MPKQGEWLAAKIRSAFESPTLDERIDDARELLGRRKLTEFFTAPGVVSGTVHLEQGPIRVSISCPLLSDDDWAAIVKALALKSLYLAEILGNSLPIEAEADLAAACPQFFPNSILQFEIAAAERVIEELDAASATILAKFLDQLEANPLTIFVFRGRNREELISAIKQERAALRSERPHAAEDEATAEPESPLLHTHQQFWKAKSEVWKLSYSIRADDLPAALIRRLGAMPLPSFEEHLDHVMEDSYAEVAKRAQAFGLGLSAPKAR